MHTPSLTFLPFVLASLVHAPQSVRKVRCHNREADTIGLVVHPRQAELGGLGSF